MIASQTPKINLLPIILISLFLSLFLISVIAQAEQPETAGKVVWVKGSMNAVSSNQISRPLQRAAVFYAHDRIVTGPNSTGEIVFTDQSVISLRANTVVSVDDYQFKQGSSEKYIVTLVKGGLRTITGMIAKHAPDAYQIKTSAATIGVRGTQFSIVYGANGKLYIEVTEGAIRASNKKGHADLDQSNAYAMILDFNTAPATQSQRPAIFSSDPPITAIKFNDAGSGNLPNGGGGAPVVAKEVCVS